MRALISSRHSQPVTSVPPGTQQSEVCMETTREYCVSGSTFGMMIKYKAKLSLCLFKLHAMKMLGRPEWCECSHSRQRAEYDRESRGTLNQESMSCEDQQLFTGLEMYRFSSTLREGE